MIVLLTGVAGFIGYHTAARLLASGVKVIGIDTMDSYYDPALKEARIARLAGPGFVLHRIDVSDREAVAAIAAGAPGITHVVHLAAQAGVRHSLVDPYTYVQSNVMGHLVMMEAARRLPRLCHFVYASSSSVYGLGMDFPLAEDTRVDFPNSVYAVTKRADELLSQAYAHLHGLPQTGLRFFTVYGPWGRPDMAYYAFARSIVLGEPITLFDGGSLKRDFTYIDDVVSGIVGLLPHPAPPANPRVLNIGNNRAEPVWRLVRLLEEALGRKAVVQDSPRSAADVKDTWASVDRINALTGWIPSTSLDIGIPRFVDWFKTHHGNLMSEAG